MLANDEETDLLQEALEDAHEPSMVQLLLDAKADVADIEGRSILRRACVMIKPESAKLLLDAGADTERHTAELLRYAISNASPRDSTDDLESLVQVLLSAASLEDTVKTRNALVKAFMCYRGTSIAILQMLLDALPSLLNCRHNGNGYSLLEAAVNKGHADAVKLLADAGADLKVRTVRNRSLVGHLIYERTQVLQDGFTHWREKLCNGRDVLRTLVAAGADLNCSDKTDRTAVMLLASVSRKSSKNREIDTMATAYIRDICDSILARA